MVTMFTTATNFNKVSVITTQWLLYHHVSDYPPTPTPILSTEYTHVPVWFPCIYLTGFYNRDGVCLLRGTDWVLK
jgi:hypothetical protein